MSDPNLWRASAVEEFQASPLRQDLSVDLAVIGGGFTGCSAALEAARQGASVALVEAQTIGHGGSGRNVGLVNAGLWLPPETVVAQIGAEAGHRLIAALGAGPGRVFALIAREGIDCEALNHGTLHLAHGPSGFADLTERHRQGVALGVPLQLLDAAEAARRTGSTAFHGALLDPRAGTIQPLSYVRGLARAAQAAGARLYEGSAVTGLDRQGGQWLITANGQTLRAKAVLVATNAYHLGIGKAFAPRFVAVSYCQFATAPLTPAERATIFPGGEGSWDTAPVMSSFRTDRAGRLILGGIGNSEGPAGPIHAAWARRKLAALYPALKDKPFVHGWRGRIAMTADHIPKMVAFGPDALACFGYSGRGICPGTVFGTDSAKALLSGDPSGLPVTPIPAYDERFTALRGAYYEAGASLVHATALRMG